MEERKGTQISKADMQDYFLILAKKKRLKDKTLEVRFTFVKFGMWKTEKDNLHAFNIPLLLLTSQNTGKQCSLIDSANT